MKTTITVQELIDVLKSQPPQAKVVMSRDTEGNGYNTLRVESIEEHNGYFILYPYEERLELDDIVDVEED